MTMYSVIAADGSPYGPVDEAGLTQWAREGRVTATTSIRFDPGGQVVQAVTLPFLAGMFQPQAVAVAPGMTPAPAMGMYNQVVPGNSPYASIHQLGEFSVALLVVLQFVTFGIFPLIWFGLMADKMPRLRHDDPSAGKHIGFMFIPLFNLYWVFFAYCRLCDRIAEQRQLRGLAPASLRGLAIGAIVTNFIPYVGWLVGATILWPLFFGMLQSRVNELVQVTQQQVAQQRAAQQQAQVPVAADSFGPSIGPGERPGPIAIASPAWRTQDCESSTAARRV